MMNKAESKGKVIALETYKQIRTHGTSWGLNIGELKETGFDLGDVVKVIIERLDNETRDIGEVFSRLGAGEVMLMHDENGSELIRLNKNRLEHYNTYVWGWGKFTPDMERMCSAVFERYDKSKSHDMARIVVENGKETTEYQIIVQGIGLDKLTELAEDRRDFIENEGLGKVVSITYHEIPHRK